MKELFDRFKRINLEEARELNLIDTCFFISVFEHPEHIRQFSELRNKAMTSFNVLELIKVDHKLHHIKHSIRKFLEEPGENEMKIIDVDVVPGDKAREVGFVNSVDKDLLKHCKDPSDAVLLAAAIKTHSTILTKDKHHLFNAMLENFVDKYDMKVYKELKDVE